MNVPLLAAGSLAIVAAVHGVGGEVLWSEGCRPPCCRPVASVARG